MATERLYYADTFLFEFDAEVVAVRELNGQTAVELDRTAFYPESGGQLADRGALGSAEVIDVQVVDDAVLHVIRGTAPAVGARVGGRVDELRRRQHAALHTGQHILSRALLDDLGAETLSSRLGATICTIDVNVDALSLERVRVAEATANRIVDRDLEVHARFPHASELANMALRREPKVDGGVRVVTIEGFDATPCGGTHCTHTSQVGLVRVDSVQRYKGGTRISFDAGPRARERLAARADVLATLAEEFTCAAEGVPDAVAKLQRALSGARDSLGRVRAQLADTLARGAADNIRSGDDPHAVLLLEGSEAEVGRAVAERIAEVPRAVALVAVRSEQHLHVVAVRGSESSFDCGDFVKRLSEAGGGRGGGRPERAEGRLPADADWDALVARVLKRPT